MKVMILAAGLATRLRPLSRVRPKLLIPVSNVTMLDYWLNRLDTVKCDGLIINGYHLHEQLEPVVAERNLPFPVSVEVERDLLGTGGGIRNVLDRLGPEPFCVINGDILCDVRLIHLMGQHISRGAQASLLLHDCPPFNNVAVDRQDRILAFGQRAVLLAGSNPDLRLLAFTGIHFLQPEAVAELPTGTFSNILTAYNAAIDAGAPPLALYQPGLYWREMGAVSSYWNLHRELYEERKSDTAGAAGTVGGRIHQEAAVASSASLENMVFLGKGVIVGAEAKLENVIAWDDVKIDAGSTLKNCIVTDGARVSGELKDRIICRGLPWSDLKI